MYIKKYMSKEHKKYDVDDFHKRKLPNFKKLFPEYKDKKIVGAVAGLSVVNDAAQKAFEYGYLVLRQA
jgi:hypothetical protein